MGAVVTRLSLNDWMDALCVGILTLAALIWIMDFAEILCWYLATP